MKGTGLTLTAAVLAFVAVLSAVCVADASDGASSDGYSVYSECGRTVGGGVSSMVVGAEGWSGASYLTVDVEYDADVMTLTEPNVLCGLETRVNEDSEGLFSITLASGARPIEGDLFELVFDISADAAEGQYPMFVSASAVGGEPRVSSSGSMMTVGLAPGDVNGDGRVSVLDSLILRKHFGGVPVEVPMKNLDVNGDGSLTDTDSRILKRHLAGADVGLSDPDSGTVMFQDSDTAFAVSGAFVGYKVFLYGKMAGKEVADLAGTTIKVSEDGGFVMPAGGLCTVTDPIPGPVGSGSYICLSLLQPEGVAIKVDGTVTNNFIVNVTGGSSTVLISGASFDTTENEGSFIVSKEGKDYILSCITNASPRYSIDGSGLSIELEVTESLSSYLFMLFVDKDADLGSGYVPAIGDHAKYKFYLTSTLLPLASIDLEVVEVHDDSYVVAVSSSILDGTSLVLIPNGVPIVAKLNTTGMTPFSTDKINRKACSGYDVDVPGLSSLKVWVEDDSSVVVKIETSFNGSKVILTLSDYRTQGLS
jgi:hypothetical protein